VKRKRRIRKPVDNSDVQFVNDVLRQHIVSLHLLSDRMNECDLSDNGCAEYLVLEEKFQNELDLAYVHAVQNSVLINNVGTNNDFH
jgi:hypothetical protein